jgi:serralysin
MRSRSRKILRTVPALESLEPRVLLTPVLHSLAGADQVIYLDFDGNVTTDPNYTVYNLGKPIVSPGVRYTDAQIETIWRWVSEDFAPFAVDVTTQEPPLDWLIKSGPGDTHWGVRAVVTADQSWLQDNVGYAVGGFCWTGSFNWASDAPAFVFNTGMMAVGDTISHEVGHALGLSHDGTGTITGGEVTNYKEYYYGHGSGPTGWAPIMGAGFGRLLSQWSAGEYPRAVNMQDDVAIIATKNGFGFRADDHGDTLAAATTLDRFDGSAIAGLISTRTDLDVFALDLAAGTLSITVSPAAMSPNLDVLAELLDANGQLIASDNPTDSLGASLLVSLPAGRYYLRIDGVGKAATATDPGYSDYGSLGTYAIAAGFVPDPIAEICVFAPPAAAPPAGDPPADPAFEFACADELQIERHVAPGHLHEHARVDRAERFLRLVRTTAERRLKLHVAILLTGRKVGDHGGDHHAIPLLQRRPVRVVHQQLLKWVAGIMASTDRPV